MILEHIILFIAWLLFYGLHSFFASEWIKQRIPLSPKAYRFIYSLLASVLLMLLLLYGATIYSVLIYSPSNLSTYIGLMLTAIGIFVLKRSFRNYSFREFVGLKSTPQNHELVLTGIQARIRHPLYTGTLLVMIGYLVFNPQASNLIILVSTLIYLPFGIKLEEKKLINEFGEEYLIYKQTTPALIPKISI